MGGIIVCPFLLIHHKPSQVSLAREAVQAEVAAFGEQQREELRLKFKSLDEVEGGFGTALMKTFPDFLPKPEMLGKTREPR